MSHKIQAITFDAAGTLFRLSEPVGRTYARFGRKFGIEADEDDLKSGFRAAWKAAPSMHETGSEISPNEREVAWWRSLVDHAFRHAEANRMLTEAEFRELFAHYGKAEAWRLYPETIEVLDQLKRRYPLAVLSNFDRRFRSIATGLGIPHYFDPVILSGEVGVAKPDPRIFEIACTQLKVAASETLHVGDDDAADWNGARQAGLQVFELDRSQNSLLDLLARLSEN